MIFTEENVRKILCGEKTQTRRPVKKTHMVTEGVFIAHALGRLIPGVSVPAVQSDPSWRDLWCVGKTVAVQPGRGQRAVGRIRIAAITYCERARDISADDARAEGFATPSQFCDVFMRLHGGKAIDLPVWCLTFSLCEGS